MNERILFNTTLIGIGIAAVLGAVFPSMNHIMTIIVLIGLVVFLLGFLSRLAHEVYDYRQDIHRKRTTLLTGQGDANE